MSTAERFAQLVAADQVPLGEACLVLAAHLGHPLPVADGRRSLAAVTDEVRDHVDVGGHPPSLDAVAAALVGPMRFRGARRAYYDPRNSLLPDVLSRRVGIPITLSIVTIEVAAALGVVATGVGMPGHFLVGDGSAPARWLDVFDGGTWLDQRAARRRFADLHGQEATFDPAYLRPTSPTQIVARVLANLAVVHRSAGDPNRLVRVLELRALIPGVARGPRDRVELAEAYAAVGRTGDAAEVLAELSTRIDPRRRSGLAARIAQLRAGLN